jgi:cytochrome c oxidase assembly protein subunit 15
LGALARTARSARLPLKSPTVAAWLYAAAFVLVVTLVVGGATRLTQSGLSITSWKPISGIVPPQDLPAWYAEFENYKKIPQFKEINPHMTLAQFQGIYWWEWGHRILARLLGLIYLGGFLFLLWAKEIPKRIVWRCGVLAGLVLLQGAVGWLMVASGLHGRLFVAPEMLMLHLFVALSLLLVTVWTGMEAADGAPRGRGAPGGWRMATGISLGLIVLQCLLGALVAGNQAGLVYNTWPDMNEQFLPPIDWSQGVVNAFFHDQALVQFMHRMNAYLIFLYVWGFAVLFGPKCQDQGLKVHAVALAALVTVQAALGIMTLKSVVNFQMALAHQFTAIMTVLVAVTFLWRVARADRAFRKTGF